MFYDIFVWAKIKIDLHDLCLKVFLFFFFPLFLFLFYLSFFTDLLQGLLPVEENPERAS